MDFSLNEEQRQLIDTAKKFAQNVVRPAAPHHDHTEEFPHEVLKQAWELGLMNLIFPVEYGGLGVGAVDQCLAVEQVAWGCAGIATSLMANDLALSPIVLDGSDELKQRFLPQFAEEYKLASFGLSEPGAGSDVAGLTTTYEKDGDAYVLNGAKQWITNATHADVMTIFAREKGSKRHEGMTCFVVEKGMEGLSTGKPEDKMGQRASNTAPVILENVRVPAENIVGKEHDGFMVAMRTLDKSRPMVAALCVGLAQAGLDASIEYAQERKAFGMPIGNFQMVQAMIADMSISIEAARLLTMRAASALDKGENATLYSSKAKAFAADAAMKVTTDAVQVHGGYGYTKEFPVEKFMRDAKLMQIYEGTAQVQRVVIAREILRG